MKKRALGSAETPKFGVTLRGSGGEASKKICIRLRIKVRFAKIGTTQQKLVSFHCDKTNLETYHFPGQILLDNSFLPYNLKPRTFYPFHFSFMKHTTA